MVAYMLLSRREPEPALVRLRVALWPRRTWRRSLRYANLRLGRLPASRHAIALGLAVGVFAAFQPVLGFQMLLAGALAWLLGASVGAAILGTFVGSPVTWPLMWLASYHLGAALTGETHAVTLDELWSALSSVRAFAAPEAAGAAAGQLVRQIFYPLMVGAIPLGLMAGAAFYVIVMRAAPLGRRSPSSPRSGAASVAAH
jgi:uncharacterized protein (DUF2062 family)